MTSYPPPPPSAQPPPPGYGGPPGTPAGSRSKGMAVASLVLGVLGLLTSFFVFGGLLGLLAVILGIVAVRRAGRGEADGKGLAIGGIVTGLLAVLVAAVILVTVGSFLANNSDEIGSYSRCVEQANGDQQAIDACAQRFADQLGR